MRLLPLLFVALGLTGGCVVPIAEVSEQPTESNQGGGAGIVVSGWDAGTVGGSGGTSAMGGTGGTPDGGPKPDSGIDSGPDVAPGPCSTLMGFEDHFDDNTPESFWLPAAEGGAIWEEGAGSLHVYLPTTLSANTFGGYRLEQGFDLDGCALTVRISQVPQSGMAVYTHFWLSYGADGYAEFYKIGEGLYFQYWQAGQVQVLEAEGYNPNVQAYWRFAHDGMNLRWETSADGVTWEVKASAVLPSTFTSLRLGAGATFAKVVSVSLTAIFDDFDVAPATP